MVEHDYDLELDKVVLSIKKSKARKVLIQLAEGLKPRAEEIQYYIADKLPDVEIYFWLSTCFGKCDIPEIMKDGKEFDMMIQFGH